MKLAMNKLTKLIDVFSEDVRKLKILVIGETIIDHFVNVAYEGNSMKSACQVLRLVGGEERQYGGATIIKQHLSNFVEHVDLITNTNDEIVKSRYIDSFGERKYIEINKFEINEFGPINVDCTNYDIIIVADFGHGFCDQLTLEKPIYLMCQTNSNNYGFNRISKWKYFSKKCICLDKREASLQLNKTLKNVSLEQIKELYNYELNTESLFLTLGEDGAVYYDGNNFKRIKNFKSSIIDSIGAGDTFFSFSVLTNFLQYEDQLTIPSLAASLSTTWRCNAESVTKEKLINYATLYEDR